MFTSSQRLLVLTYARTAKTGAAFSRPCADVFSSALPCPQNRTRREPRRASLGTTGGSAHTGLVWLHPASLADSPCWTPRQGTVGHLAIRGTCLDTLLRQLDPAIPGGLRLTVPMRGATVDPPALATPAFDELGHTLLALAASLAMHSPALASLPPQRGIPTETLASIAHSLRQLCLVRPVWPSLPKQSGPWPVLAILLRFSLWPRLDVQAERSRMLSQGPPHGIGCHSVPSETRFSDTGRACKAHASLPPVGPLADPARPMPACRAAPGAVAVLATGAESAGPGPPGQ